MAGVDIVVPVDDPDTALLTYTQVRVYRDTTPGGTFATLVNSASLVSGTFSYTINDATGDGNRYYRWRFYNTTGPVQSGLSEVIAPAALTMRRLRIEAATLAGAGFAGTCSAAGTTLTLRDTVLLDSGVDAKYMEAGWIYRPDAALPADYVRRIKKDGFDASAGDLSPNALRPWTNLPALAEVYHAFMYFPPIDQSGVAYSWDRAIRDGLFAAPFVDLLDLGAGDGTSKRFDLAAHRAYVSRRTIRRVLLRMTDSNGVITDRDASLNGSTWFVIEDAGSLMVELLSAPTTQQSVIVEVNRRDTQLYTDTDTVACPEDVAVRAVVLAAFWWLNSKGAPGKYGTELTAAQADFREHYTPYRPSDVVRI